MKKKTIAISIIISILLIGIVSAGLIDYFGRITGSVEVKGPVFYATLPLPPPNDGLLLINEEPSTYDTYLITDGNAIVFWTKEDLEGIDFNYIPKLDLHVRAEVNNPSKLFELTFGYSDTSGDMHDMCSLDINITTLSLSDYHTSCEVNETLTNVNEFFYKMQGKGDPDIEYSISTENTKVEMSKAT